MIERPFSLSRDELSKKLTLLISNLKTLKLADILRCRLATYDAIRRGKRERGVGNLYSSAGFVRDVFI